MTLDYSRAFCAPLSERLKLPRLSGLYVVRDGPDGTVLYVGRAQSFRGRWSGHHRRAEIESITDNAHIYCFHMDHDCTWLIEQVWFHALKPTLQRYEWDEVWHLEHGYTYNPPRDEEDWFLSSIRFLKSIPEPEGDDLASHSQPHRTPISAAADRDAG